MYLIYTRRSTDDADNQKNSLEYQETACKEVAERRGLSLAGENITGFMEKGIIKEKHSAYKDTDLSISGMGIVEYEIERPKFMQMVRCLLEGKYEGVIVLCWDRISRSEQSDMVVKNLIDKKKIKFIFVQADYAASSAGALHRDIDGMFAKHWSRMSSEKIGGAMKKMMKEGLYPHAAPIGYLDQGPEKKPHDPERMPFIREIWKKALSGEWTIDKIFKWAKEKGLTPKPRRKTRTHDEILAGKEMEIQTGELHKSHIHRILSNTFYYGEVSPGIMGKHEPIISKKNFEEVQYILHGRVREAVIEKYKPFIYRKKLHCGSCGYVLSPYHSKGHLYYGCIYKSCSQSTTKESVIDDAIIEIFLSLYPHAERALDEAKSELEKTKAHGPAAAQGKLQQIVEERQKLEARLKRVRDMLIDGTLEKDDYENEKKGMADKLETLIEEERLLTNSKQKLIDVIDLLELIILACVSYSKMDLKRKREILNLMFLELVVKDKKLAYHKLNEVVEVLTKPVTTSLVELRGRLITFMLLDLSKLLGAFGTFKDMATSLKFS